MSTTMREDKRKRLERRGWSLGTTAEFLGLSPEESAYIELKIGLATGLKMQRTRRKLSQIQLARLVKSSQSRVAKMEAGDASVSIDLLVRAFLALGVSRKDIARVIESTPTAAETLV